MFKMRGNLRDQILSIIQGSSVIKYSTLCRELMWPYTQHYSGNLRDQILSMIQGTRVTKYSALSKEIKW